MIIGSDPDRSSIAMNRSLDRAAWAKSGVPLLRDPRGLVTELHRIHLPAPETAVLGVLDAEGRLVGSASMTTRPGVDDGWLCRNVLLDRLRRIIPDGLRRTQPSHTAVLMVCRRDEPEWTEPDGAWMWGLRDACTLHGLRCGAFLTFTGAGWKVLGDERAGRNPHLGSRPQSTLRPVSALPQRAAAERAAVKPAEVVGSRLHPAAPAPSPTPERRVASR